MFGYLTGISCAVMVAKIHQDFPDYDVVDLVYKFFEFYSCYDWQTPVAIKFGKKESMSLTSWKHALDNVESDLMAILSPNYELRNTTQRVGEPTFDTLVAEIKRAWAIMQELVPQSQKCYLAAQGQK
jgi:poly(A) polymerase